MKKNLNENEASFILDNVVYEEGLKKKALRYSMLREMYAKKREQSAQDKLIFKDQIQKKLDATLEELVELKNKIYSKLTNEAIGLNLTQIDALLNKYSRELRYFKILDEEFVNLLEVRHPGKITNGFYDSLFLDLSNTNENFLFFTPLKAFTHGYKNKSIPILTEQDFHFGDLDKVFIKKFQRHVENEDRKLIKNDANYTSLFKNNYFINNYMRFFPNQIKNLTSPTDIKTALSIDPEKINEVSINLNLKTLSDFVSCNKELIVYLSNEQIENLASTSNSFANALLEYPEVIYRLDPYFFLSKKHSFIHVFGRIPHKELVKNSEAMSYFVGWDRYISGKSRLSNCENKAHKRKSPEEKLAEIKAQLEDTTPID